MDRHSETQICVEVDKILNTLVLPFAEVRQTIIDMFGMSQGANLLVVVAYGERNLNRVWSAASDGHLPEARSVLPDVISAFEEATELLEENIKKM
jgi:hypothetical protein